MFHILRRERTPARGPAAGDPDPVRDEPADEAGEAQGQVQAQEGEAVQPHLRHPTGLQPEEE